MTAATPRYTKWFGMEAYNAKPCSLLILVVGTYTQANHDLVQSHFGKVLTNNPTLQDYSYECGGSMCGCRPSHFFVVTQF